MKVPPVTARLLMLFLLGVDWAADPASLAPALQLLASSEGSTENVCPSTAYREDVRRASQPAPRPAALAPRDRAATRPPLTPSPALPGPASASALATLVFPLLC
jgi:hypothetical protein